ncbi:MAG: Gmad2 immunoglobulin-like domain-containing protein [Actinomycetes bacterium]
MTGRPDDGTDPRLADALRRALARSAAEVQPAGDGLTKIRVRTAAARRQRWLVPLAATTAAIVVGGGVAWAAGTLGDRDDGVPIANASTSPVTSSPAATTTTGSAEVTDLPIPSATVPVYYLGAQPSETGIPLYKVFREFRRLPAVDVSDRAERVRIAVTEMVANEPLDDDYFGQWPQSAAVLDTSVDPDSRVVTVDFSGLEWTGVRAPDGRLVPEIGEAVVQQLVYTATAAASKITAEDEFSAAGLRLLVDGEPVDEVLGVNTSELLVRDPVGSQAIIWITDPELGETVGDPFTVQLVANLFEGGPATWELSQDGTLVAEGLTSMGESGKWFPYEFTIDENLEPGTYELLVFDAVGRGERDLAPYDTKTFTVG